MFLRALIVALCLMTLATKSTIAQQVVVRSGEHEGFSRLVVDLPRRVPWKLEGEGKSRKVVFERSVGEIDISQAFDRISRERILRLRKNKNGSVIEVDMTCSCNINVYWHGAAMLVIDIKEELENDSDIKQISESEVDYQNNGQNVEPFVSLVNANNVESTNSAGKLASARMNAPGSQWPLTDAKVSQEALSAVRKEIAQDISRAAAMGFLKVDMHIKLPQTPDAESNAMSEQTLLPPIVLDVAPLTHLNFETRTAEDIYPQVGTSEHAQTGTGQICIPDEMIDIANWGTSQPFVQQISSARSQLIGEFDQYTPQAMMNLARLYVYFGFGEEAEQVLEAVNHDGDEASIVLEMANIINNDGAIGAVLKNQMDCNSDVALWSALVSGDEFSDQLANANAMLRTLGNYPEHLRSLIGPRLARLFSAHGRPEESARILRLLNRQDEVEPSAQIMARAEKELVMGSVDSADHAFEEVINQNSDLSAEALVAMVGARLKARNAVEREAVHLIESYAVEQRGSEIGTHLFNAYIGALAASGDYERSFSLLSSDRPEGENSTFAEAVETVAYYTAYNASDLQFLKSFLLDDAGRWRRLSSGLALKVAERLFSLGFHNEAEPYLMASRSVDGVAAHRLLQARMHLAKSLPRAALTDLVSIDSAEADELRARAYGDLGDHQSAHRHYISAGNTKNALREALLAEAWGEAEGLADPIIADVIGTQGPDVTETSDGKLAQGAMLLEQSASARADIVRLLGEKDTAEADAVN